MRNSRYYYSSSLADFLYCSKDSILGSINNNDMSIETRIQQKNSWDQEIDILKDQLKEFTDGYIFFEYTIPRMGKRVDTLLLYKNIIFVLEFKCGDSEYRNSTYDQVYDYALDLQNFHKESHNKLIVPIMVSTSSPFVENEIKEYNRIIEPLRCNDKNIAAVITSVVKKYDEPYFDYIDWGNSVYLPTPTIVEAAKALYWGHNVHEITRCDAGAENLTVTTDEINKIIEDTKRDNKKSICFVTGVPGAGKTLVGLNLSIKRSNTKKGEHAVFLTGNYPLVRVLQEALAIDNVLQEKEQGVHISKIDALRKTSTFIQIIHRYRDSFVENDEIPPEHVVIFDEAQRAWTHKMIAKFMSTKKGVPDFPYSEPEFLISTMDRHDDWAVIICLVGGGQEINSGEAGLPEWFDSLRRSFKNWDVYITPELNDSEYIHEYIWKDLISGLNIHENEKLHLATSIRSFRTPELADFVNAVLNDNTEKACCLLSHIKNKYPIVITRDLNKAKIWIKEQCRGTTRYGLLASSGGLRLKPEGVFVKNEINVANWFLNGKDDVRSSYSLEDVVTEFDIQGLEIDYSLIAWDADLRFNGNTWSYYNFVGNKWNVVRSEEKKLYLKNAYRVLLTRARQGMVIFIPEGSDTDETRKREYYDKTYEYLKIIGINEI